MVIILTFLAGMLSTLAPCVLPLLPVIVGGSIQGGSAYKKRPYIIAGSLVVSLILFTLLLKATTLLIDIDARVWSITSGILVVLLGLSMLFPQAWPLLMAKIGSEHVFQRFLGRAHKQQRPYVSAVLTGAALGPVFSSCSPMYAWVIATVLPSHFATGLIYLAVYCLGVTVSLLAVSLFGRRLLSKTRWATRPNGWFQRIIACLFIAVGLAVAFGIDKKAQTYLVDKDFFSLKRIETLIVPND